jgi:2-oxoglutarate dehydrogenase complex dehydrogenase (E1) component-like enzyme
MLPPLKEKDDKDAEGVTFDAKEIEEGFAESQMQEIGMKFSSILDKNFIAHLRQQVSAYRMTILQMNEYHNRMLHDFQAAMAYENFLRAKDAGVHPSMLFTKRFQ